MDTQAARAAMIDSQVRVNDVTDRRLIHAMGETPRELFVADRAKAAAYADMSVDACAPDGSAMPGRKLMAPRDFAKLLQSAEVVETDRILAVACGSGYAAAVLARLGAEVVALEAEQALADAAAARASSLGLTNVKAAAGTVAAGCPKLAPFDVIFVDGAVNAPPQAWIDQLAEGGRLAVVVRADGVGSARIYVKSAERAGYVTPFEATVAMLPGFEPTATFQF